MGQEAAAHRDKSRNAANDVVGARRDREPRLLEPAAQRRTLLLLRLLFLDVLEQCLNTAAALLLHVRTDARARANG